MFGTHDLWLFVLSGFLLNITPGPDTLYIVGRGSTQGWRAGAFAALGIGAGTLVHISAAALGLSAILAASATAFVAVKFIGAAYLLYLGISLIRSAGVSQSSPGAALVRPASILSIFVQGFLTNVLNPKVALFFLAFLPQFVGSEASSKPLAFLLLGAIFDVNGTIWNLATHAADPDFLLASSVNGEVFYSTDAGDSWSKFAREFGEVHALIWVPN